MMSKLRPMLHRKLIDCIGWEFFKESRDDLRDPDVPTHSFPTRRSSDLFLVHKTTQMLKNIVSGSQEKKM